MVHLSVPVTIHQPLIVDVCGPDFVSYGGVNPLANVEDDSHCALCGQGIAWRVVVQDGKTGETYAIGRTCAKTIKELQGDRLSFAIARAQKREKRVRDIKCAQASLEEHASSERASGLPHPMQGKRDWAKGKTYADYLRWWAEKEYPRGPNANDLKQLRRVLACADHELRDVEAEEKAEEEARAKAQAKSDEQRKEIMASLQCLKEVGVLNKEWLKWYAANHPEHADLINAEMENL